MPGEFQRRAVDLFRAGHRVAPIPRGEKGVREEGWTAWADTQDEAQVRRLCARANGCGVGVLAKWTAGVDVDVRHPELAQRLAGLAHDEIGWTVERIGEAPKVLLPYRVERPFRKLSTREFSLPGDPEGAKPHKVEVLADGQQWVAYHVHPGTGRPYAWPEGDLPPRDELAEITEEKARLFLERAEAAVAAAGGRFRARAKGPPGSGDRKPSPQGQAGTREAVAAALAFLPNRDLPYDEWIEIGLAIRGSLGEAGRELWDDWSAQAGKNDQGATEKAWRGFRPELIGAGTIYHLARERGWKPDPALALNPEKAKAKARREEERAEPAHHPETGEVREGPPASARGGDEAWKARLAAAIDEMNAQYFVAAMGGRGIIGSIARDDHFGRERLVLSRPQDIKLLRNHRHYRVGTAARGGAIWKDLGSAWIEHPRRRTYDRIALIPSGPTPPGVFNLWRGFGVRPAPGGWPRLREHLLEVVCTGNEKHLEYLLGWCAHCVQHPGVPVEVAVVMRGEKGAGKGAFGQVMIAIFRDHALHITQAKHLTGNFNAHLADALLLFVDEAFWAGDRQGEGTLKALVTEPSILIEPKGIDSFMMPNRLKIMMASNSDWVVPASADERRYFVLDVSSARRGDYPYFVALKAALDGGELAAFLDHLIALDLTGFNVRAVPTTRGLERQKLLGADSVTTFWHGCLLAGAVLGTGECEWPVDVPTQELHAAYVDHARDHGDRHPADDARLVERLGRLWEGCDVRRIKPRKPWGEVARPPRYVLASLERHRAAFLKAMGIEPDGHEWPAVEEQPDVDA